LVHPSPLNFRWQAKNPWFATEVVPTLQAAVRTALEAQMGFTNAHLQAFRGGPLPDLLGPSTQLLFVGINPGLLTVAVQSHFGRRGNRFYPALYRAGIVDHAIDASAGFVESDRQHLLDRGVGITSLVRAATARADELTTAEL